MVMVAFSQEKMIRKEHGHVATPRNLPNNIISFQHLNIHAPLPSVQKKKLFNANTDDPIASFSIATSTHRLKLFSGRYSVSDRVHYSGPVHETKVTGGFRSATPNQMRNIERIIRYHSDQIRRPLLSLVPKAGTLSSPFALGSEHAPWSGRSSRHPVRCSSVCAP